MSEGRERMDCAGVLRQLWDYLDGELTPETERAVHAHLEACSRCYPQVDFERAFLAALASARVEGSAPAPLRQRVIDALCAEGFNANGGSCAKQDD